MRDSNWLFRVAYYLFVVTAGVACSSSNGLSEPVLGAAGSGNGTGGAVSNSTAGTGSGFNVNTTGGSGGTTTTLIGADASGPACGDGAMNQPSEACDDGNALPGDGCNGLCEVETGYTCQTAGAPCVSLYVCGNGVLDPGEVCDDFNSASGDGCSSDCLSQDAGYACATPGKPCTKLYVCGDGRVTSGETCDDKNSTAGDGCSDICQTEAGWVCLTPGKACALSPRCGDSNVDVSKGEVCDDGNSDDGDGCSADCQLVESGWSCPTPGSPCNYLVKCGDKIISGSEVCDDGNTASNDGCSADCSKVESGYVCPYPGAPCVTRCGDGVVAVTEQCDDGKNVVGDGCSATCQWESGWACTGTSPNYTCHKTTCGDATKEGTEGCDDGNGVPGDGCDATCHIEPICTPGAGCTSKCGDGLVILPEECDDGNTTSGDGCSSTCKMEGGYTCSNIQTCEKLNGSCIMRVPVVYRDFIDSNYNGHPDFQIGCGSMTKGLLETKLNASGVPVLAAANSASSACIASKTSFNQWYDFSLAAVSSQFSGPIPGEMILWESGASGNYVNRYGADGTPWKEFSYNGCSNSATSCAGCTVPADGYCFAPCTPFNSTTTSCFLAYNSNATHDGTPLFFPIDNVPGAITPLSQYSLATVPAEIYNGNWVTEPAYYQRGTTHNFGFTSRVKYWFTFDSTKSYTLTFTGDDDVWVFINGMVALDLGGPHVPASGTVTLNATTAASYNLTSGGVYDIQVFQAERKKTGSSYMLTLTGFNTAKSTCIPVCGDGIVTPGEECDNGTANNTGGYGKCKANCTRDIYCGDGAVNGAEACDNGINNSAYNLNKTNGCAAGCVLPPYCGDVTVQTNYGETCDDGTNSGAYGTCTSVCQRAPWCGDAIIHSSDGEQCDDGKNDGTYGTCAPSCQLGQRCGDGTLQSDWGEQCDLGDGKNVQGSGCSPSCKLEGGCGDSVVESGEQCDDGANLGGYGKCAPGCVYGPHCGDTVVQKPYEQCDDGTNAGGYGQCAAGCVYGPYCGDNVLQPDHEECDHGSKNGSPTDACSGACKKLGSIVN